jgi:hypothetical protein
MDEPAIHLDDAGDAAGERLAVGDGAKVRLDGADVGDAVDEEGGGAARRALGEDQVAVDRRGLAAGSPGSAGRRD